MPKSKKFYNCYSKKIKSKNLSKLHSKKDYLNEIKRHVNFWKKINGRHTDKLSQDISLKKLKKILNSYRSLDPEKLGYKSCKFNISKKLKHIKSKSNIKKNQKRKSKYSKKSCIKQSLKKYKTRNSPPYSANKCCGKTKKGNDKNIYISKRKGDYCRWFKKI